MFTSIQTPVGPLGISATKFGLEVVDFLDVRTQPDRASAPSTSSIFLEQAYTQLQAYFAKERALFTIKLNPQGTPFQQRVWRELLYIPYGCTTTYGELARKLNVKSAQAVGQAVKKNPLAIIIPCHRVLPQTGSLKDPGGYAGGLWRKRWLLAHEQALKTIDAGQTPSVRYAGAADGPHIELNSTARSS